MSGYEVPFKRILIANRGEIAVRVIRACREMGIVSIAVYSEADSDALHVHLADEAYPIGGSPPKESYLNIERILSVARQAKAEAIHPGYGFLSENPAFAEACEDRGLVFIGPTPAALCAVGSKTAARRAAQAAGVPIVPGSVARLNGHDDAVAVARTVGYPVLLKAVAGGGGKGMRIAHSEDELWRALMEASGEAGTSFGDSSLYVEKLVRAARHVEVQLLADNYGNIVHLGERDCSIQRRYQKVIEESPSPAVDDFLREHLTSAAIKVAQAVGYRNAGTVEFLVDGKDFYFIEVNARLQVEHPVTEMVTGIDIVKEQICIAAGQPLRFRQGDIVFRGAAIQCRIYAEDPAANFTPSPGTVLAIREPRAFGVRVDSGIRAGSTIPLEYDGLLAKLVVWGDTRAEAIRRMKRALDEYQILGICTTIPFKRFVIDSQLFSSGQFDTNFIDCIWDEWTHRAAAFRAIAKPEQDNAPLASSPTRPGLPGLWKMFGRWWAMQQWQTRRY
jgi:acetyl-CoA carboxylase biotin carboxylase subunit